MLKNILFIILTINIFPINGTVGIMAIAKDQTYDNSKKYSILPIITLNYKNYFIEGTNIKVEYKINDYKIFLGIEPGLLGNILEKGDLSGKILEDRKNPVFLNINLSKNKGKNLSYSLNYKKDFSSGGNLINIGTRYSYFIRKNYTYIIFPTINTSFVDDRYANYYYNYTQKESKNLNKDYNSLKNIKKISLGIGLNTILDKKNSILFVLSSELTDKNIISNKKNEINNSMILGINHKFGI